MTDAQSQRSPDKGNIIFWSRSSVGINNCDIVDVCASNFYILSGEIHLQHLARMNAGDDLIGNVGFISRKWFWCTKSQNLIGSAPCKKASTDINSVQIFTFEAGKSIYKTWHVSTFSAIWSAMSDLI